MKLTDRPTPETDAIQGNGIHQVTDAFDHARKLERERDYMICNNNKLRADFDAVAGEACQLQDALGCPCEFEDSQARAMNRIRDLIAAEGELGDAKEKIEKLEAECTRLHGLWHAAEERNNVLRETVKPVIEALAEIADTDDFRGVAKALVRCHSLLDQFPDFYSQNVQEQQPAPTQDDDR